MRDITPALRQKYEYYCKVLTPELNVDTIEHLPTLNRYAQLCNHITEFGVRYVVSTWALLAGKPEKMVSYDVNYHPNIEDVKKVAAENHINYIFTQADDLKIEIEQTDLLFIDTLHVYNQLKQELALHHTKVSKYIILHDTATFASELQPAVNEFLSANPQWKIKEIFTNNNGLTILQRQ